jgi:hypothetical protein
VSEYRLYIDDSGHPDDQPFVVVAGFVSTAEKWAAFETAWPATLRSLGLKTVFHMTDFMTQKRKVKERSAILETIRGVIAGHTLAQFTGAVDIHGYRRVNDEYALEECLGAPLALAARGMALDLNRWKVGHLGPADTLLLFAEEGSKHRGDLAAVFERDRLPAPTTVKKSVACVQPADILAWSMFDYLRTGKPLRRVQRLIGGQDTFGSMFREDDLRRTVAEMIPRIMLRSELTPAATISFHTTPKRPRKRTIK